MKRAAFFLLLTASLRAQIPTPKPSAEPTPSAPPPNPLTEIVITSPAAAQFDRAMVLFSQQQYSAALQEFAGLAKLFPSDSRREESLFRIAECYRLMNRTEDALSAHRFFVQQYPDSLFVIQSRLREGDLLMEAKDYAGAIPPLETAVSKADPTTKIAAQYSLALCYSKTDKVNAARALFEELASAKPPHFYSAMAALNLADSLEKSRQLPDALKWWQKTLSLSESKKVQGEASARGGWIALQLKNEKEALALFETCRRLDSESDWRRLANTGLLRIAFDQKRHEDVIDLYKQERQNLLDSTRADVFFAVGQSYFALKNPVEASALFDLFLKSYPTHELAPTAAYVRMLCRVQLDSSKIPSETASYIAAYPQSPFLPAAQLMRAKDFSSRGKFSESIPMWEFLASSTAPDLPSDLILFEWGRALFQCKKWAQAAEVFQRFAEKFKSHDLLLPALTQRAIALQTDQDQAGALSAWEQVLSTAPPKTEERQTALEQLGLLAYKTNHKKRMASAFEQLLQEFPKSRLGAQANYHLGIHYADLKQLKKAIQALKNAREGDPEAWQNAATQRLVFLAYDLKDPIQAAVYLREYEALQTGNPSNPILPAAIYFWLGQYTYDHHQLAESVGYFAAVNAHPSGDEFRAMSWWLMAEAQRAMSLWKFAITSYERYRQLVPERSNASDVLLALAHAHLGAQNVDAAQPLIEKIMLQEPEGPKNAESRLLLGELYMLRKDYASAAKAFAALSLLYKDPQITPSAMKKASVAFERAGDSASSAEWMSKLKKQYPHFEKVE